MTINDQSLIDQSAKLVVGCSFVPVSTFFLHWELSIFLVFGLLGEQLLKSKYLADLYTDTGKHPYLVST